MNAARGDGAIEFLLHEADHIVGPRKRRFSRDAATHVTGQIQRRQRQVIAIDVEPEPEGSVAFDLQLQRRLSAPALTPADDANETRLRQAAGDVGDRRRGEPRLARDVYPCRARCQPNGLQYRALIIVAGADEIGAGQTARKSGIALIRHHCGI